VIPSARYEEVIVPVASATFTGMRSTSGATPATPTELSVHWAIVPATWVPWPSASSTAAAPVAPVAAS
jgi:hypothetical protein